MTHPFFDAFAYPWTLPLANLLWVEAYKAYDSVQLIRTVSDPAGITQPEVNWLQPAMFIWRDVLQLATATRRLEALCGRLAVDQPRAASLQPVIARIKAARAGDSDIVHEVNLPGNVPFLDRRRLRMRLQIIQGHEATVQPILFVGGAAGSGKSYTRFMVQHVAAARGDRVLLVNQAITPSLADALNHIASTIAPAAALPPRNTTDSAWYRTFWQSLRDRVRECPYRYWIVADDLGVNDRNEPRLDPEILKLCEQLALLLVDPSFARSFRLVLLGHPGPRPTQVAAISILDDTPLVTDIGKEHVADYIVRALAARQMRLEPAEVDRLATEVVDRGNQAPPCERVNVICSALRDWFDQVLLEGAA